MSPLKYQTPPLIEAIMEIHTLSEKDWEDKTPFEIYAKVNDRYSEINRKPNMLIPLQPHEQAMPLAGELIQFWNKDKNQLMHIAPGLLTVNCLKPYIGWEKYSATIEDVFNKVAEVIQPKTIKRVVYRVVNIVDIHTGTLEQFQKYFQVHPSAPQSFVDGPFSIQMNIEKRISETETSILWMYTSANVTGYRAPVSVQLLYIDDAMSDLAQLNKRVNNVHSKVNDIFENLFTSFAKNEFKPSTL